MFSVQVMLILPMKPNMEFAIIMVAEEAVQEKQLAVLLVVLLQN
jgi:hypothetical protein